MKILKKTVIIFLSFAFLLQCAKSIRTMDVGPAGAKQSIIIAAYYSDYKNGIVEGLVERFKGGARITVVPLESINSIDTRKYDAVVIIDALRAWKMFNTDTAGYIGKMKDRGEQNKIVLFMTAGNPAKNYSFMGIDCMTGASQMNTESTAIDEISAKVQGLLRR